MKKLFSVLLLSIFTAYSYEYRTNFAAGLSLATGDLSSFYRPGPSVSFEPNFKLNNYCGIGFHIDYSWLSFKTGSSELKEGMHFIDVGFVPKLIASINKESEFFVEVDPSFCLGIAYWRSPYSSASDALARFGLTLGTGVIVNKFLAGFKFKSMFLDDWSFKWVNFYIGYSGS